MLDLTTIVGTRIPRLSARFFPDLLWRAPVVGLQRTAYLTFDDGPTPEMTEHLLTILDRFDAKATFFMVGAQAKRYPALVEQVRAAGHQIGNHTYTHPDAWYSSTDQLLHELEATTHLLEDQLGMPLRWMRPPYGRFTRAMREWCLLRRQRMTMWDVMPGDFLPSATTDKVARRILTMIRPGSIIVLHDNPIAEDVTLAALAVVLERLTADGWHFPALGIHEGAMAYAGA